VKLSVPGTIMWREALFMVTKDGAGYGNPRLRLTCLNHIRLEAGDSSLQNESPQT
jgi:hypothetical protein